MAGGRNLGENLKAGDAGAAQQHARRAISGRGTRHKQSGGWRDSRKPQPADCRNSAALLQEVIGYLFMRAQCAWQRMETMNASKNIAAAALAERLGS